VSDLRLEYLIRGKADRCTRRPPIRDTRTCSAAAKAAVATKCDAFGRLLVARNDRLEHRFPSRGRYARCQDEARIVPDRHPD